MKTAYSKPAPGEFYLVSKKRACDIVKAITPDLQLLTFQTMHIPKFDPAIPYLATFRSNYLRVLSIPEKFLTSKLSELFETTVLPYVCQQIKQHDQASRDWPSVIVCIDNKIHRVPCSQGWQFPNRDEIERSIKKQPNPICTV